MLIEFFDGDAIDEDSFTTAEMSLVPRVGENIEFDTNDTRFRFVIRSANYRFETRLIDHQTSFEIVKVFCCMDELERTTLTGFIAPLRNRSS